MLLVSDIWSEAKEIFGHCDERKLLQRISDAVQLLANKGDINPLIGTVDICVQSRCVTFPREVQTVLALNIGGQPTLGHDELFRFHLNGPGDCRQSCDYSWVDGGSFCTYRDLICPSKLIAFLDRPEDAGKELRVFGYDEQNRPLRTNANGVWTDGYLVPTIFSYALPESNAPKVARITTIKKGLTVGNVRLSSFDSSTSTGTLIGIFEPDETLPQYRRVRLNRDCPQVSVHYRRKSYELLSQNDRILLHSRPALILAMHAIKKYKEVDLGAAAQLEAHATRLLSEQESVLVSPVGAPVQVEDRNGIKNDGWDNFVE